MPPNMQIDQTAQYAAVSTAAVTIVGLGIRFLMKTFRTDRLESVTIGADASVYTRLQNEIKRLEAIVQSITARTVELENRLNYLRDIELDDVADIAMLTILIGQMPCHSCKNPDVVFNQAKAVLDRMNKRKRETQQVFKGGDHVSTETRL